VAISTLDHRAGHALTGGERCGKLPRHEHPYNTRLQTMTYDTLRTRRTARPFQPFRVVTSRGEAYGIRHPEMAIPLKHEPMVFLPDPEGVPERYRTVSMLHITALEPMDTAESA
jgi:hypothetical protein